MLSKESEVFANGRLVVIDFNHLNYEDFPLFASNKDELLECVAVVSNNGTMYINEKDILHKALLEVMKTCVNECVSTLKTNKKKLKRKYRNVKSFEDIGVLTSEAEKIEAIGMLLIDVELTRREVEMKHYFS